TPERLADQASRVLMQRVVLTADAALTTQFPQARAARVRIILRDGRMLEHFSPHRKGDPAAPLSDQELNDKFAELVTPVIGDQAMKRLRQQIWQLDELPALAELNLPALGR